MASSAMLAGSKPASTARVIGQQWFSSSPPTSCAVSRWVSMRTSPGFATCLRTARTAGMVTEWSPPSVAGTAPASRIWAMSRSAWANVFSALASTTSQSPQSTGLSVSARSKSQVAL
jgi:hypothetical protein